MSDQSSHNSDVKNNSIGAIKISLSCVVSTTTKIIDLFALQICLKACSTFLLRKDTYWQVAIEFYYIQSLFRARLMLSEMAGLAGFVNC